MRTQTASASAASVSPERITWARPTELRPSRVIQVSKTNRAKERKNQIADVRPVLHEPLDELEAAQVPGPHGGGVAVVAVAAVRLADPGQRVERREARTLVVRGRHRLQQGDRELEVAVLDGED